MDYDFFTLTQERRTLKGAALQWYRAERKRRGLPEIAEAYRKDNAERFQALLVRPALDEQEADELEALARTLGVKLLWHHHIFEPHEPMKEGRYKYADHGA